ncbi:MAG: hypothetical protein SGBAC_004955 [Bacillariaceae sp.]
MSSSEEEDEPLPNIDFSDDLGDDISSVASQSEGDSDGSWSEGEWSEGEGDYSDDSTSDSDSSTESEKVEVAIPFEDNKNPKIKQFFERMQHFFEMRRNVEDRADLMDPSDKFRHLKVKVHSGGIEEEVEEEEEDSQVEPEVRWKKEYQQKNLDNSTVKNVDELYKVAEQAQKELKRMIELMLDEVNGLDDDNIEYPDLKPRDRAYKKAKEEYRHRIPGPPESWIYDVVRASVICKSFKQVSDVNKWLSKHAHIVSGKNRFAEPSFTGYRDMMYHVLVPVEGELAHICELQIHHKDIKALAEQSGLPKHYEFFRSCFAGDVYQGDVLQDLAMMNKYGTVDRKLMDVLKESQDAAQLKMFAELFREKLEEFDSALHLYQRISGIQLGMKDDKSIAETYYNIALTMGATGDVDGSIKNFNKALVIQENVLGSEHIAVAETNSQIGHMLCKKCNFSKALKKYQKALRIREANSNDNFVVVESLKDIGLAQERMGEYLAAEESYRKALEMQESFLGDVHPDAAATRHLIGNVLCEYGDYTKAMDEHRLALSIRETEVGKNNLMTAESHTDIGIVLTHRGDYEVAEWRHRKALKIRETLRGKEHEECAISLKYLGDLLCRKKDWEGAINELTRAQGVLNKVYGMDHPNSCASYIDLGNAYLEKGIVDKALQEFRRAKGLLETTLGRDHPETVAAYSALGRAYTLQGDSVQALNLLQTALEALEEALGKDHPKVAATCMYIADALLVDGNLDESLVQHRKALSIRANILSKDHPDTAVSCARVGDMLGRKGDFVGASVAHRQSLSIIAILCGDRHQESAAARVRLARILAAQGDFDAAIDEIQQAIEILSSVLGNEHEDNGRTLSVLGSIHSMMGDFEAAQKDQNAAVDIFMAKLGKKHPWTVEAKKKLELAEAETKEKDIFDPVVQKVTSSVSNFEGSSYISPMGGKKKSPVTPILPDALFSPKMANTEGETPNLTKKKPRKSKKAADDEEANDEGTKKSKKKKKKKDGEGKKKKKKKAKDCADGADGAESKKKKKKKKPKKADGDEGNDEGTKKSKKKKKKKKKAPAE